ncbi:transcription factor 25 [Anthonomus grandis grandis]|uniref:transcription factor 25 n=1 Tax=Anthonomus grandis grandis TaxID=2921223 RepID=UPI002165E944|nr:transcription factor 25 [Anthonomus grandis grandis]
MSNRVMRKLLKEQEKDLAENENVSDIEIDAPVGGARKKQLNINRYELLGQQSHSESEVKEDDNETEAAKSCEGDNVHELVKKKRKKRKKKSGKHSTHRSSEDNADIDEVERSIKEVNRLLGECPKIASMDNQMVQDRPPDTKTVLTVQHKHLNPNNELKRIFGSKVVQAEHKRKNRGGSRTQLKRTWMVACRDNWPQVSKSGLSMSLLETKDGVQYFTYEHSQNYRQTENRFLQAVESLNPENITAIINERPYHVNALIQLSDIFKLSDDLAGAAELIERALYFLEFSFHPLFNVAQGNCRLDYRRQENRALFITIFKHLNFLGGRGCCRTALEFCKVLLNLDPKSDPLGIKLIMDFYALRAKEYEWLIGFVEDLDRRYNLLQLPNFAFSTALAYFYVNDIERADYYLQEALLMFPSLLMELLDKCSIRIDSRVSSHSFFTEPTEKNPTALNQLVKLYVNRTFHVWKDADILPWLERNVHDVLDRVDKKEPIVEAYKEKRLRRYAGALPISIVRHIVLSDNPGVSIHFLQNTPGPIMGFDPLPPNDSINLYTRPRRITVTGDRSNALATFLGSLLPMVNPQQVLPDRQPREVAEDEAQVGEQQPDEFRRSIASLVDAMRDLLNNIRPELQQNDADDDADFDTADET